MKKRIGLSQRVSVIADRGERRDCLDQSWARWLLHGGYLPVPLCNAVESNSVGDYLKELDLDGVILTGGNDIADLPGAVDVAAERDQFERLVVDQCATWDLPLLGVCRGFQLLIQHYGGVLKPVEGHVAVEHDLTVVLQGFPLCDRRVNSFHRYGVEVDGLGTELEAVAIAPDGSVEAIRHRQFRQWGTMWHPERGTVHPEDLHFFDMLVEGQRA